MNYRIIKAISIISHVYISYNVSIYFSGSYLFNKSVLRFADCSFLQILRAVPWYDDRLFMGIVSFTQLRHWTQDASEEEQQRDKQA